MGDATSAWMNNPVVRFSFLSRLLVSVILRASSVARAFPEAKGVMVSSWCLCVVQVRKADLTSNTILLELDGDT